MVLIAAVIVDEQARKHYLQTIPADVLFGTGHALIWSTLQAMDRKGLSYDPLTMRQMGGELDTNYVDSLIEQRPTAPSNLKHHIEMLHWDAARVNTAKGPVTTFLEMLKDPKSDPLALRSVAKQIEAGLATGANHSLRNPAQLVAEQMAVIRKRREGIATYGFGIEGLDYYGEGDFETVEGQRVSLQGRPRLVPGTSPGTITVVTGVSGSGKTTATSRAVLGMYCSGRRITFGAYEQGSGMSLELLATMNLGYSRTDIMTGKFDESDEREIQEEMERLSQHIIFDEIPYNQFDERKQRFMNQRAMDRIAQSIVDSKCDVFVADLFRRTLGETDPSDEELALYKMQEMAKQLRVHLILVQQQNSKQVEATKRKLPSRDTIKGSGVWVEVPDEILAFYRPALYKNIPDDKLYSLILKQRYGRWPLMIEHDWDPTYGVIEGGKSVDMQFGGDDEAEGSIDAFFASKKKAS
jgi:hypothetical protein